jgi:hypothetical protein
VARISRFGAFAAIAHVVARELFVDDRVGIVP